MAASAARQPSSRSADCRPRNRLLINYLIHVLPRFARPMFAFWGHGRNFQSSRPEGPSERWKRFWATRSDWWFAYTDETKELIESYGFPPERITVFDNAIDTQEIRQLSEEIGDNELELLRKRLRLEQNNTAVYVGGLYSNKRLTFLIEAAIEIKRRIASFNLIIVGAGEDRYIVESAAQKYSWIHYLGPLFGREKVEILKLGKMLLMPGLVGLSILDAAAVGLPMITTAYPYHSPEIAYLSPGCNGLIVKEWEDPAAFAEAVALALSDEALRSRLAIGAINTGQRYTIERMAQRFSGGVMEALSEGKRV